MNTTLTKQKPAKKNIVPCIPKVYINNGKYFNTKNEKPPSKTIQNVIPKSFTFSGIISDITRQGKVDTAQLEMKKTNEKLMTGTQLNADTSTPFDSSQKYAPETAKPRAVPAVETRNKNC